MKVWCEIVGVDLENDSDRLIEGVSATCGRCGHVTESFGVEEASRKRCLVLLREECPNGENNFYADEDER